LYLKVISYFKVCFSYIFCTFDFMKIEEQDEQSS
jgi:hypothetical protein